MNISLQRNALFTSTLEPEPNRGRKILFGAVIGIVLSALSACASPPATEPSATLEVIAPIAARPDGAARVDTENREVVELWAAAERARADNRPTIALELLYEAIEIDPQNALLWSRAAEIQLDQVEPALAENYATRSNASAGDNNPLLYRNWLIIEHARSMRGDLLGVRDARKQVQLFQYR